MLHPLINKVELIKELGARGKSGMKYALYRCECGTEFETRMSNIRLGTTRSCGCLAKKLASERLKKNHKKITQSRSYENMVTHGLSKHPLYNKWVDMKSRCYNKNSNNYRMYGLKGVTVCQEWKHDFKNFYDWAIDNGWEKGLEIDKDIKCNMLGISPAIYSPDTCLIVTRMDNQKQMREDKELSNKYGYTNVYKYNKNINKYRGEITIKGEKIITKCKATAKEANDELIKLIKEKECSIF